MIIDICDTKQKDFLSLPTKPFTDVKIYESIIIVPTKYKHESGWKLMAIIGCGIDDDKHNIPYEIAGYCDDINWIMPNIIYNHLYPDRSKKLRTDMTISNCIRIWSDDYHFEIGMCTSSTDIKIIPIKK